MDDPSAEKAYKGATLPVISSLQLVTLLLPQTVGFCRPKNADNVWIVPYVQLKLPRRLLLSQIVTTAVVFLTG